jgi:L-cysteine S-thiosulfotransferase
MNMRLLLLVTAVALAACAAAPTATDLDARAAAVMKASFKELGIAKLDRIQQDPAQAACSSDKPPPDAVAKKIEADAMASIKPPPDGKYIGDWKAGETLAQNGRGLTWTDTAGAPSGGNCYNCHQIAKAEISYGTIGPSLYQYGKLRGVKDPASAESAPIVQYTWGKLYNSKATNACSGMPRFGHAGILTAAQMQDVMALLLDPKSPVNE